MSSAGRGGQISLAALVGALAAFALSPVPVFFDAEWLAWVLVPAFAVVGGFIAFIFPALTASEEEGEA